MYILSRLLKITNMYIIIFVSLFLWAIFAYYTLNELIDIQKGFAKIINVSGKQRMLSQKTTLIAKRIYETNNKELKIHLGQLIDLMKRDHTFLINNISTEKIERVYFDRPYELDKNLAYYVSLLDKFYINNDLKTLKKIEEYSLVLLPKLNFAVNSFEEESNEKIEELKQREFFILIGTIFTLILEAFLIVIPSIINFNRSQKINKALTSKIKEQARLLKEEKELISFYLDSINSLIILLDKKGNINIINKNGANHLGYKVEDLVDKNWFESGVLVDSEVADVKEYFKKIISKEIDLEDEYHEYKILTKDGEEQLFKWSNSLLIMDNEVIGVLSSGLDITIERRQNEIIAHQTRHVAMGEMIGNIAHQWRQPLSIISMSATSMTIQKETELLTDEQFYESCNNINEYAQYLSKTIDDFGNYIKGDDTHVVLDIKDEFDKFLNLVKPTSKMNNIKVKTNIESVEFISSSSYFIQCFMNIFNNAKDVLKDLPEDIRYLFIDVKPIEDKIFITFKDTGGGIKEDALEKIFDPYFTTKHQYQGTGLGLSMTYDLVVNGMNGIINVENDEFEYDDKKYKGAKFMITLPRNV